LDERGRIRFDSRTLDPQPINYAERDFFVAQRDNTDIGRYIGRPFVGMSGRDLIGISRRLTHPDGSFACVVVGILRLEYFQNLFKNISLDPRSSVTLSRTDGTVLMRWPYRVEAIGKNIRHTALFQHVAESRSGQFEANATSDGVQRLIVYRQIDDLPLVVGFGQATEAIFAQWRRQAIIVGLLMTVLCGVTIALSAFLVRELKRRGVAERQLAVLATTDELTGLSNRRHFRAALQREWQRAMRDHVPVSLLMIDVDMFKVYNDRYGHQAGDELLNAVAVAISENLKRAADLGARYGGDELAVLLPGTPLAGAAVIAEQIRSTYARVFDDCGTQREQCSVSVGVASLLPDLGRDCGDLIASADEALYRAKANGRNRVDLAISPSRGPAEAPADASRPNEAAEAA
jgi:diguanylate cyclase (GGDEF)-like protein